MWWWLWWLWLFLFVLIVLIACCSGIALYVGWQLTHPKRKTVDDSPDRYGLTYEPISFASRSKDVRLQGWFIPALTPPAKMTLILAHGYAGTRLELGLPMLAFAKDLISEEFQVVMFDFRNCGESEGTMTTVGYHEKQDLLGAIDWVKEKEPSQPIGLIGYSMGAATSILAAGEEPDVMGVVADSPFHRLTPYVRDNLPVWSGLPHFPFTALILRLLPPIMKVSPDDVDVQAAAERIYPRPILFIHSEHDEAIPYTESKRMFECHSDMFSYWQTSGAQHVGSYAKSPQLYVGKVKRFFNHILEENGKNNRRGPITPCHDKTAKETEIPYRTEFDLPG
ncbi:lysophospholipase [Paenibacillus larvae]|uniref:alpha/beta hydrolase n=1 Tax=Paenibacillus larvae TaxID=1464 RepID=UPI002280E943|nr:alpha/beta fold hydrolase [Paenibacillus larvae]MCY9508579.1 lysophospholipase [Paenibacillus larvae]MCY9526869.1 lysophospholipase [Paenibacillus larvae]